MSLAWLYKTASTDQNGRFTVKGVRPGEYKIYAWEEVEQGAYMDPDFVKPHESAGEAVSIKDSAQATVQLKAVPAESSGNDKTVKQGRPLLLNQLRNLKSMDDALPFDLGLLKID